MADRLLDAPEVSERLGVPLSWVRDAARRNAIPHVRLGRYVRFDPSDIERWIEEQKQPAIRLRPAACDAKTPGLPAAAYAPSRQPCGIRGPRTQDRRRQPHRGRRRRGRRVGSPGLRHDRPPARAASDAREGLAFVPYPGWAASDRAPSVVRPRGAKIPGRIFGFGQRNLLEDLLVVQRQGELDRFVESRSQGERMCLGLHGHLNLTALSSH